MSKICVLGLGYIDLPTALLLQRAKLILTDSGGVLEESCILKVPCVMLRDNKKRPETVEVGANVVAGKSNKLLPYIVIDAAFNLNRWENPYGTGMNYLLILTSLIMSSCHELNVSNAY